MFFDKELQHEEEASEILDRDVRKLRIMEIIYLKV